MTTLVSVGNATQPFRRLLRSVEAIATRLPQPVIIQYGSGKIASPLYRSVAFLNPTEFERLVRQSRLLILHAGAGSVIHALTLGKLPVVMPRRALYGEHVDDHQVEFAEMMAGLGKIILAREPKDLDAAVVESLTAKVGSNVAPEPRIVAAVAASLARIAAFTK